MSVVQVFELKLNIDKKTNSEKIIVTANDNVKILAELMQGKSPFPLLPEYIFRLVSKPKGRNAVIRDLVVEDGKVVIPLNHSETGYQVPIECVVQVFDEEGNRISSAKFDVVVLSDFTTGSNVSPSGNATFTIVNEEEFNRVSSMINEVEEARGKEESINARFDSVTSQLAKEQISANTIILLGDSITAQHVHTVGGTWGYSARGFFTWANVLLRHRFDVLAIKGVGGQRTDQILSRIYTDVVNHNPKPKWCLVEAGVNDIGQKVSAETIILNLLQMYTILNENGIKVIATTVTPTTSAATQEQLKTLFKVNSWIKRYCFSNSGVILCDWNGALTNPSTGLPIDSVMSDGVHPSIYGASIMGKVLFDSLKNITPEIDLLINSNFEDNILANGMLEGNVNGLATGWSTYLTSGTLPTASKVSRTDLRQGEWQQLSFTDSEFSFGAHNQNVGVDWEIGDVVFAQCEFETDDNWVDVTTFNLAMEFGGATPTGDLSSSSNSRTVFIRPESGVLRTPAFAVPEGTTRILFRLNLKGTGTIRIAKCQISKA